MMTPRNLLRHIISVAILALFLVGCGTPIIPQPTPLMVGTPTWSKGDLEIEKRKGESALVYDRTIHERPPFYENSMPLKFTEAYAASTAPGSLFERPLLYDFGDFRNLFIYEGPMVIGAQTYDSDGNLVAEVVNLRFFVTEENEQGIEIEELHYGSNGEIVFKSKSQIAPYSGFKIKETEKAGRKLHDYYFIWPVGK